MRILDLLNFGTGKERRELEILVFGAIKNGEIRAYVDGLYYCKLNYGKNIRKFVKHNVNFSVLIDNLAITRIGIFGDCLDSNEVMVLEKTKSLCVLIPEDNVSQITITVGDNV